MPAPNFAHALLALRGDYPELYDNETWAAIVDDAPDPLATDGGVFSAHVLTKVEAFAKVFWSADNSLRKELIKGKTANSGGGRKKFVADTIHNTGRKAWSAYALALYRRSDIGALITAAWAENITDCELMRAKVRF